MVLAIEPTTYIMEYMDSRPNDAPIAHSASSHTPLKKCCKVCNADNVPLLRNNGVYLCAVHWAARYVPRYEMTGSLASHD